MNKGKGNKQKERRNQKYNIFQRGWWTKPKKNMDLWKGGQKENQETKESKNKRRISKTGFLGDTTKKKDSEIARK